MIKCIEKVCQFKSKYWRHIIYKPSYMLIKSGYSSLYKILVRRKPKYKNIKWNYTHSSSAFWNIFGEEIAFFNWLVMRNKIIFELHQNCIQDKLLSVVTLNYIPLGNV